MSSENVCIDYVTNYIRLRTGLETPMYFRYIRCLQCNKRVVSGNYCNTRKMTVIRVFNSKVCSKSLQELCLLQDVDNDCECLNFLVIGPFLNCQQDYNLVVRYWTDRVSFTLKVASLTLIYYQNKSNKCYRSYSFL